jgi:hypothetical protein
VACVFFNILFGDVRTFCKRLHLYKILLCVHISGSCGMLVFLVCTRRCVPVTACKIISLSVAYIVPWMLLVLFWLACVLCVLPRLLFSCLISLFLVLVVLLP